MAEINRELRQQRAHIGTRFIPLPQPIDGEGVAERMQRGTPLSRTRLEIKLVGQTAEGITQIEEVRRPALLRNEEALRERVVIRMIMAI